MELLREGEDMELSGEVLNLVGQLITALASGGGRERIINDTMERLEKDGDIAKIGTPGPYTDADGEEMTGNVYVVHQTIFAIVRSTFGGWIADRFRDPAFNSWGRDEAEALLAGITPETAREGVERILNRFQEQLA